MLMPRPTRGMMVLAVTALLTLTATPSAVATPATPAAQISLVQEEQPHATGIMSALNTISDMFSCAHHPSLPWCG